MRTRIAAAILVLGCASCGSKAAVAVSASVEQPMLSVIKGTGGLALALTGTFVVRLQLGSVAPEPTDASIQSLTLQGDPGPDVVLKTIANPAGSIHLEPGQQANVQFTVTDGSSANAQVISAREAMDICGNSLLQIRGSASDTASGSATPFSSATFDVAGSGCTP